MTTHTFVVLAYKESKYLEQCILSVLNQEHKSDVVIATSTPNFFISSLAKKYNLNIFERKDGKKGIGYDFDFARTCVPSDLVTIAHQDDFYEPEYSKKIIEAYDECQNSTILFTDYYEIRNGVHVYENKNLKIKRCLLKSLKNSALAHKKFFKRISLAFGNSICCPAVTFCNKNIKKDALFSCDMLCNIDWYAWEQVSNIKGCFNYIPEPLMGHRIHEESTTTEIIENNNRSREDYEMFKKFWVAPIAKVLTKLYSNSEKSNKV